MPLKHTKSRHSPLGQGRSRTRGSYNRKFRTGSVCTFAVHIHESASNRRDAHFRGYPKGTTRALAPHSSRGIPKCSLSASSPPAACLYLVAPHRFWTGR